MTQETLTIEEVAEKLLCDKETAAEKLNRGDLPGLKFGRSWVIPAAAFYQRLNEMALEQAARLREMQPGQAPVAQSSQKRRGRPRFTAA